MLCFATLTLSAYDFISFGHGGHLSWAARLSRSLSWKRSQKSGPSTILHQEAGLLEGFVTQMLIFSGPSV